MGKKAFELFPKGKQFKDEKGNVWTVDKHDKNMEDSRGEGFGFIRLRNEKKRAKKITPRKFLDGIAPHGFTTGIKELDDFARKHLKTYSYEERKYK